MYSLQEINLQLSASTHLMLPHSLASAEVGATFDSRLPILQISASCPTPADGRKQNGTAMMPGKPMAWSISAVQMRSLCPGSWKWDWGTCVHAHGGGGGGSSTHVIGTVEGDKECLCAWCKGGGRTGIDMTYGPWATLLQPPTAWIPQPKLGSPDLK